MIEQGARSQGGDMRDGGGNERRPYRVRLPGFISDTDIGLGDVIKRAASTFGIRPCGGCEKRGAALNRWLAFSGRRPR